MPTDNSNAFSPQDLTRTEDQNRAFPNARGQVVPAIESAPEEPQDWKTPMAEPEGGFQPEGTPLTIQARPKEVNKILNSKHVLSDVDTSDPSNARVFVANFLNSKYDEDKRGIYKDYEGKTKAYGLSGDPVADAKSIRDGDTKTHESSQTRIAKDRKVIAEGLDKLGYEERQGFGANAKNTFDRGFLDLGVGTAAQGALKGIESMGDEMERIERGLFEDLGITYYDEELGGPVTSEDVQKWREDVRERNTVDPEFLNSYTGGVIQGYGQAAAIVPAFLLNPAVGTGMSVAQAYQYGEDGYRDFVKSEGITYEESEARKAGLWNMPSAAVDVIANRFAIGKILKPLKGAKITKGGALEFLKDTAESAAMGSGTEGVQTVWENLNAKYLSGYDRDKVLTDGVVDAMVIGAFVDSTITAGGQGVTKGVNKLLGKTMDPVEGMSAVDMALAQNVVPEAEFNAYIEEIYGDQTTEEGVPLQELAQKARQGDRKAAEQLVEAVTVEASRGAVEAGLTPAEAEARGKEAAEVADPVEPLVETPIDKEISTKKEELAALEEAEDSTPEDMKVGEKLDKEIQALETKRDENQRPADVLSAQAREEAVAEEAGLLTRRAEDEIEIDKAEEVADAIDFFEQRSRGGVAKDYKPDTRKGGEALIKQMRRAGMSKKEIAAKSLQIMTEAGRPNDRLSDQVVRGEQTSNSKAGNDFRATVKLYKDADPMDVAEEYIHAETDREVNEGTINYEDIAAYREQVESVTSGEDTRGNTENDHKEWIAEQVKARLLGNRHDTRLPDSFARFIDRIISRLRNLFTRANELIELEAQGMLPDGFVELLDRLGSMDDDALMQSIQAEQAAETASDPKDELLEVMKRNKLSVPRPDSDPSHRGELETYFESIGKKWKYLKKGGSLDSLKEGLQAAGFNVDTPSDVLDLLDRSARGEAIYANTDSRSAAQQTADETFSLAPIDEFIEGSEVVNPDGSPKKVFHGSPDVRAILSDGFKASMTRGDTYFFSDEYSVSDTYADDRRAFDYQNAEPQVLPAYLSLKNPLRIDGGGRRWRETEKHIEEARKGGHDGIIIKNSRDEYQDRGLGKKSTVYVVFSPKQIKSASDERVRSRIDGIDLGVASFSLGPLFEQDADSIVTERTEEIQSRTPERQAFIDYQRELRRTDGDNTADQKEKLQKLLQLATDADEIEALKQAGDKKIIRVVEQKVKQIRKQAAEREDVTESVKALERLINSPEVPMEVRARMRGYGRLAERKTPQGKARWVEQMANKLEAEIDRHYRTRNVRTLRSLLRPFATEYAPNRRKLRERVGEEARADLNFAQRLLNNSEATPPEGMADERRDELIDIFGDVGNRQSSPTRVKAALEIAGSIAKGGRTARDDFKEDRRDRNEQVGDLVREEVLNGEEAMGKSQIAAREKQRNVFKKGYDYMRSRLIRGMEGFQQQLNKMDSVKGGILEDLFLPAVYQADQNEKALNREHVERVNEDFKTVLGTDNRQAASWYENSHELHDTDIEWIEDKAIGMEKRTISKQQGVALFMQWLDPSLRSTFSNMGINESTIEQVKEFIGEIGVSEAYYFRERYAEMGIRLNAKHMEVEGIPLDMIDGYGGRARRINSVGSRQEDMQMFSTNSSGRPTVKSGSMKERTNSTDYLIFQDAAMDFSAHAKEVNHYISHAELAKNLSAAFLNNARARNAITQKHGADFYESLKDQVEAIIEGDPKITNKTDRDWNRIRSNVTKAQLMAKPAILIKQLTSAPAFVEEIGPVAYAKAAASLTRNARKFMPMIWGSEYVKNRMSNSQFADIQQQLDQRDNTLKGLRWDDYAMMNVKWGDIGAVIAGGAPVYVHAYNEAKAAGMTNDQAQTKAEEVFGLASERAQQSSATHAKGAFLRGKGAARTWFMYLTSPLQYQRNVNTGIANLVANVFEKKAGRKSDVKKAANQALRAIVIYHVLLPQIFQAVASGLVGFTDDEDYIKEQFWAKQRRALYAGNLNAIPLAGQLITVLANLAAGTGESWDSSGSPIIDLVGEVKQDFEKAVKNGDDLSKWLELSSSAGLAAGIPVKTINNYYDAITDISEGNTEHPFLLAGGWSKWSIFED